jgi:anti-sigma regulatory factor (Ser/Thr protein kinase)
VKKIFKKELISLKKIFEFLNVFMNKHSIDKPAQHHIHLAVEEIFTNMVKYNDNGDDQIELALNLNRDKMDLSISLTDFNAGYFSMEDVTNYDPSLPIEKRYPGNLGIYLTKKVMDFVASSQENGNLKITLIKKLEH